VLFFGDSTSLFVSRDDLVRRSVVDLISKAIAPSKVCAIAGVAYHAGIYEALLRTLGSLPARPRVVVITVNVRQFATQWAAHPDYQFAEVIQAAREMAADPSGSVPIVPPFRRQGEPSGDAWNAYRRTAVDYPGREESTVGAFLDSIWTRGLPTRERQRAIFAFHYLFSLTEAPRRLASLREAVLLAQQVAPSVVAYLGPINHEAATELLGSTFDRLDAERSRSIVDMCNGAAVRPNAVRVHDWTRLLPRAGFFHAYEPSEHLNELGRGALASRIVSTIRDVL